MEYNKAIWTCVIKATVIKILQEKTSGLWIYLLDGMCKCELKRWTEKWLLVWAGRIQDKCASMFEWSQCPRKLKIKAYYFKHPYSNCFWN